MSRNVIEWIIILFLLAWAMYPRNIKAEILNEEVYTESTTDNLTPGLDDWDISGGASSTTCSYGGAVLSGEVCTSHHNNPGTITSPNISMITDGGLTVDELNQGFNLDYGIDVQAHPSNASVPYCSETSYDCKDSFIITLTLFDQDNNVINTIEDEVVLTYYGTQTHSFDYTQGANTYSDINMNLSLWGKDFGWNSGWYGPIFSNPSITATYDIISYVTTQVNDIIEESLNELVTLDQTVEVGVTLTDDFGSFNNFTVDIDIPEVEVDLVDLAPTIEIAEIETLDNTSDYETQMDLESQIEVAELDLDITPEESNEEATEEETEEEATEPKAKPTKAEAKAKITQAVANKILERIGADAQYQTLGVALIAALGADLKDAVQFKQTPFYISNTPYAPVTYHDPYSRLFSMAQEQLMDEMIQQQYKDRHDTNRK